MTSQSDNMLNSVQFNPYEVETVLKSLKTGKASGPDSINNRILKELSQPLSQPLCDLFNFSIVTGKVPDIWKQANISPIFKKIDASDPTNYRPISLLSSIGKVLEKIMYKRISNFFRDNQVITTRQSGFVPGDSTVNQLVDIYNTFYKALDKGKEVRAIFCDISKAFDRVWHKGLLFKHKSVGIGGSLLNWFTDYLDNRVQRVVLPGTSSSWASVNAGVPQGSMLVPLLFLVYINDIVEAINSTIRLFADDTSLYFIVDNPTDAAEKINSDMEEIHQWASKWLVTFNPSKSESLLFSRKHNRTHHSPIYMNQQPINEVNLHKHLGITFSSDCKWHDHILELKTKAWHRINIIRELKFTLDRKSLKTIYFSFIRPLLEYADVVWDYCSQYEVDELEKIQIEAARVVTGATKFVSIDSLYTETGWKTLSSRRLNHKLLFFKTKSGLCPIYFSSLVPPSVGNNTVYSLRNANDIETLQTNTQLYYISFLPSSVCLWIDLPDEIQNSNTKASFKTGLNVKRHSPPAYYNAGKRLGRIYHSRLRTKCSSLNEHLFSKNIVDSSLCTCVSVEDTKHFILECPLYFNLRQEMLTVISEFCLPSLNVILFGNPDLTTHSNTRLLDAVQSFILKTKRFLVAR